MIQKHCFECGTALIEKELEEEGIVPYCPKCQQYRFPMYNVAVSMIVVDEETGKILLIQQYGKPSYILVAGYVNRGEAEEHAVVREVREETGLEVEHFRFNRTRFFEPSNTLMCNFTAFVKTAKALHINHEVDRCKWFTPQEARENIRPNSLAAEFLNAYSQKFGCPVPCPHPRCRWQGAWEAAEPMMNTRFRSCHAPTAAAGNTKTRTS